MKTHAAAWLAAVLAGTLVLTGCGTSSRPSSGATPAVAPERYDAEAFFATTSYSLAPGYAWSPDDARLLINSDETGIFNVYALDARAQGKQALTTSTLDLWRSCRIIASGIAGHQATLNIA